MFKTFIAILIFVLAGINSASATEQIYTEESIFKNVSIIDAQKIEQLIEGSLIDELQSDRIKVDLRSFRKGVQLSVKREFFDVEIVEVNYNKRARRFNYKIAFKSDDFYKVVDALGSYDEIVSVPALSTRIPHGTVIKEENIEYVDVEKHKLRHDTVLDKSELIGKSLKHSKSELRPIRKRDVQREQVVKRSDNIDIVFETEAITLTAKGVAMEDGAKGDVIRVRNTSSNKIIMAKIKNSSEVKVETGKL
jgi:flagella basal body P-ring formation protein FlgA